MSDPVYQARTRQELYDAIRESSKDEFILEEMIRYGFWPAKGSLPEDPADEIRRIGELERELQSMRTDLERRNNIEAILRALRKQRMEESRAKRKANKERRIAEAKARTIRWNQRRKKEILYLGEDVSGTLSSHTPDKARLEAQGLTAYGSPEKLAEAMGLSIGQLRFLTYNRKVSKTCHYKRFSLPKKTGGERQISAPMPRMKAAQAWVLENILSKVAVHEAAHGFRIGHSIVTNAAPHVEADVVINMDLKDFFPTITYRRIWGVFRALGYSPAVSTTLSLLCSEAPVTEVEMDGQTFYIARGERALPQGAPTSPALTNILCRRLDRRLVALARQLDFKYTRYADDLTFSASGDELPVGKVLGGACRIAKAEGFEVRRDKTRVMSWGRRQEVTGIVVNKKLSIERRQLRKFRATLHQIERDGFAGKRWGSGGDLLASIEGYANFVAMVDRKRAEPFLAQISRIKARHCS